MLLNPTHTITFSGSPPDLLDAYVRYKKGIVKWLSQHAPAETRQAYLGAKTLPINDLAKLASVASKHVSCMPEVVLLHRDHRSKNKPQQAFPKADLPQLDRFEHRQP
jgi:hypothetical protein